MRYDRLKTFSVFADELSFTRAAKRLHLSQPALHLQVQQLAEELGVVLYTKDGRSLTLTPHGMRVRAFARALDEQTERFLADLRGQSDPVPLVLCAGEAITRYVLASALRDVRHPVRLLVGDTEAVLKAVREGAAHVGVTGAVPALEGTDAGRALSVRKLMSVPQMLAVPRDHPLAARDSIVLGDVAGEALVVPPPGRPHRVAIERMLGERPYRIAAEVHGWDLMLQLVDARLGLAVVNGFVAPPADVLLVPIRDLPTIRYDLVLREAALTSPAILSLVSAIERAAQRTITPDRLGHRSAHPT